MHLFNFLPVFWSWNDPLNLTMSKLMMILVVANSDLLLMVNNELTGKMATVGTKAPCAAQVVGGDGRV